MARVKSHIIRYERLAGKKTSYETINHKSLEIKTDSHKVFVRGKDQGNPEYIETIWGTGYRFNS